MTLNKAVYERTRSTESDRNNNIQNTVANINQ